MLIIMYNYKKLFYSPSGPLYHITGKERSVENEVLLRITYCFSRYLNHSGPQLFSLRCSGLTGSVQELALRYTTTV